MAKLKYTCACCKYVKYDTPKKYTSSFDDFFGGNPFGNAWCGDCTDNYGKKAIKVKGRKHPVLTVIRRGWK